MERITHQQHAKDTNEVRTALAKLRLSLKAGDSELSARSDSEFLLRFLRCTDMDAEAAYAKIQRYYKVKSSCHKVFKGLMPSVEGTAEARRLTVALPYKDLHGRPIVLIKPGAWNPSFPQVRAQRAVNTLLEHLSRDPLSQTVGICVLLDFGGWSSSKALASEIGLVKQQIRVFQDVLPLHIQKVHVVRQAKAFNVLFTLLKPFLSKDDLSKIQLHGECFDELHAEVPKHHLPSEYGGTGPSLDFDGLWERLREDDSEFRENNIYGYHVKS